MWVNDNNDTRPISRYLGPLTTGQWVFKWSLSVTPRLLLSLSLYYVRTKRNPKVRKTNKKELLNSSINSTKERSLGEMKAKPVAQYSHPKILNNQHWLVDDGWWHMNEEGNWADKTSTDPCPARQQQIHTHKKTTRPIHYANTGHNKLSCTRPTSTQPNKSHYPAVAFQSSGMKISNEEKKKKKKRKKENKRINCVNVLKECGNPSHHSK